MTEDRTRKLEIKMADLNRQMKEHCKSNDENFEEVKEVLKEVKDDIKTLPDKMASKWVETFVKWYIVFMITTSIGIIIWFLQKMFEDYLGRR